jgi:hypothetical protein
MGDVSSLKMLNDAVIGIKMQLADIGYILQHGNNQDQDGARNMLITMLDMSVLAEPVLWTGITGDKSWQSWQSKLTPFWQSELQNHVLEMWKRVKMLPIPVPIPLP